MSGSLLFGGAGGLGIWVPGETAEVVSDRPVSWLVRHPLLPVVYSSSGGQAGTLDIWDVSAGRPQWRGGASVGGEVCHLLALGRQLIVVHYDVGRVSAWSLAPDGTMAGLGASLLLYGSGPDPARQRGSHPHQVLLDPFGRLLVVDLGADLLRHLAFESGRLVERESWHLPAGTGPRHGAFAAPDRLVVTGELANVLAVARWSASGPGDWQLIPASGVPVTPNYPSDVIVAADHHVLAANRGADTLARVRIAGEPAIAAEFPCGGQWPRSLCAFEDLVAAANQGSDNVAVFRNARVITELPMAGASALLAI